ncbi:protein-methionine-sulfoxide reductase catalytic subunit MsrP [Bacteroidales bacterium AH-315-N07]|nr:protein-methionine-sulfoxide reductase catalytic subunit MsrP [Bacteroidales bacterium AH-315-N07]
MASIIIPKPWQIKGLKPIDEKQYYSRREILKQLGLLAAGSIASSIIPSCYVDPPLNLKCNEGGNTFEFGGMESYYPAVRNNDYETGREMTKEYDATHLNNYYEFNTNRSNIYHVYKHVSDFDTCNWEFEVSGLANNTGVFSLEEVIKMFGIEERTYRFRCVETWAMAVPWVGFPLHKLISFLDPKNEAKYIRMTSYSNSDQMPGIDGQPFYPWPYFEGLRMDEAMNELTFIVTGIFGKSLPKQNGAPMRLIVPWKYGFKSIKAIVKIEFLDYKPDTFWPRVGPLYYEFFSNVDPEDKYTGRSQKYEHMIPDGEQILTSKYNGYGDLVAQMY